MKNGFVQVKVVDGAEVRANEKGQFLLGALMTHNEDTTEINGIAAGAMPCIHDIHAAVKAIAGTATVALLQQKLPPQLIEAALTDAIEEGVREGVMKHVETEMPELHQLGERMKQGDIGALFELLMK